MTHAPETGAVNLLHFLAPVSGTVRVSCQFGTGFIWYQIPVPIRALLYSKPESVVHVTEMIIYDLLLFNLPLSTIPAIIIAVPSANSYNVARRFHPRLFSVAEIIFIPEAVTSIQIFFFFGGGEKVRTME